MEYAATLHIKPHTTFCFEANLPLVRAILSWSAPATGPNFVPVWGNVVESHIQIAGHQLVVSLPDLLASSKIALPASVDMLLSPSSIVKLQPPKALSAPELVKEYAASKVPSHRFLQGAINSALLNPAKLDVASASLAALGIDVAAALASLQKTAGSTEYEQLGCIGLEEGAGLADALVGTIVVKLPAGYLGNQCAAGSKEYVAFWIDWGGGWQWVGTATVTVHDVPKIPAQGLSYAVYQPVDLNAHRKPCEQGPVTAKVRAILSWNAPPPPSNPNFVPVWGNQLDTVIFVDPGVGAATGDFTPTLTSVCEVPLCSIDQTSGWAFPGAGDAPFGSNVSLFGIIPGAPTFSFPLPPMPKYQITVQQIDTATHVAGVPQIVTDTFGLTVLQSIGGGPAVSSSLTQTAAGGYFTYQETNPSAAGWRTVSPQGLLGVWNTAGKTGTWLISVIAYNSTLTTPYPAGFTICPDGTHRQGVVIDLDQLAPVASLAITGYKAGGVGPVVTALNCQTFTVGDVIVGSYSVQDAHLGGFSLQAEPTPSPTSNFTIDGVAGNGLSYPNPALPLSGTKTGTWTYNTAGLPACGYTIELFSNDRTIVDCGTDWQNNSHFVGFCLVAPSAAKG